MTTAPAPTRLLTPSRVLVTRSAAALPHGRQVLERVQAAGVPDVQVLAGHVERVPDPSDGRRVRLRMTERAHALAGEVFGTYGQRLDEALRGFTADELRTVAVFLEAATRAAEDRSAAE